VRPDLRGHGGSPDRGRIGMDEWCADLAAVLEAERAPRAVVAGHCLGANVAVEFATRRPDAVAGLVLIEPMLREALRGSLRTAVRLRPLLGPVARLIRAVNALGVHRRRVAWLDLAELDRETRAAMSGGASEALMRRHASLWLDLTTMPSGAYLQSVMAVSRGLPDLGAIRVPVLVLLSTGGALSDPALTARLLRALPNGRIVQLPAQHWIPTEQPEAMRHAIEEWCAGVGGGAARDARP
jgi:pimeloyl-ACP methyl ester carboxylesterase